MTNGLQVPTLAPWNVQWGTDVARVDLQGKQAEDVSGHQFSNVLSDALEQAQKLENGARSAVEGLMTGTGSDVHDVMIATEKATMAFDLVLAVRNKAVQSYQSVMNMQF
jgi:flagellar hook-basal body complex protein FliE